MIVGRDLAQDELASDDKVRLVQLVSAQTGMSSAEAEGQVASVFAEAQQSADAARKAASHALLWMFIALLLGAFTASLAATIGGRQRDHVLTL